ncbi:MAG: hypothetical protein ACPGVU_01365 [Limisphaerales bacterium]
MNIIKKLLVVAVAASAFGLCASAEAQDANRDETKRQLDRLREQLAVKDADEWSIISERLAKVLEIRGAGGGGRGGFQGRGGGGRGRGQGDRDRNNRDGRDRGQDNNRDRAQGERDRPQADRDRTQGDRERPQGERGGRDRGQGGRGGDRGGNIDPNSPQGKLRAALESNASSSRLAGLLKIYRAEREANSAKLAEARAALREVVTTRQEVILVMSRLLD